MLCVVAEESGLLVHCISGWDRTPLFVSLLRLSLWAVSSSFFSVCSRLYQAIPILLALVTFFGNLSNCIDCCASF